MERLLSWAVVSGTLYGLAGLTILMVIFTFVLRAVRVSRDARRRRLDLTVRPLVLAVAIAEPDELADAEAAISALDAFHRRRAVSVGLRLLPELRGESHSSLSHMLVEQGALTHALELIRSRNWVHRARGAEILGHLEWNRSISRLRPLVDDPSVEVRIVATRALGHCEDDEAIPILIEVLTHPDRVPATITNTALLAHPEKAGDQVLRLFAHPDSLVRRSAALLAGHFMARGALPALEYAIANDPDDSVRIAATKSVAIWQSRTAIPVLMAACAPSVTSEVRIAAATAIALFPESWTTEERALLGADDDCEVRRASTPLTVGGGGI